jgi:ribulose-5-phosphate 4-epimerase/fuculose-1-phosphate aldolase
MATTAALTTLKEPNKSTPNFQDLDEQALRTQLAAAYRIVDYFGWSMLIFGHITVRIPGPERHFLINPFGLMFHEITASNLVKIDLDGNIVGASEHPVNPAGFVIHSAIHAAREDVKCVIHVHTRDGMAVAALADGLNRSDFAGASLYNRVAYHDFEGLTVRMDERERLVQSLGDKYFLILRNHGLLSCGGTVAEAFLRLHTLQNACEVQVAARATGARLLEPSPEVCETHAKSLDSGHQAPDLVFAALMRLMDQRDPSYRD